MRRGCGLSSLKETLARVQEEQRVWVAHNFGDRPAWMPLMGCLEELGELAHSHLKEAQGIRNHENHEEKAKDAIADTVIYLCDYCSAVGVDIAGECERINNIRFQRDAHFYIFRAGRHLGEASRLFENEDGCNIRQGYQIEFAIKNLINYCMARGWNFEAIISETWDKVKQRDWKKNPDTAHLEVA